MKRTQGLFALTAVLAAPLGVSAQDVARSLAATCANCHGTDGRARDAMPPLAGRAAAELVAQFNDFKSGNRPATIMHQIAKGYTDEQVRLIADWFARQPAQR